MKLITDIHMDTIIMRQAYMSTRTEISTVRHVDYETV